MITIIVKKGEVIFQSDGFFHMGKGDLIFIEGVWHKVIEKSLHFPQNRLLINVE